MECHDLCVDAFATADSLTRCRAASKPFGVRWEQVSDDLEKEIGALRGSLKPLGHTLQRGKHWKSFGIGANGPSFL